MCKVERYRFVTCGHIRIFIIEKCTNPNCPEVHIQQPHKTADGRCWDCCTPHERNRREIPTQITHINRKLDQIITLCKTQLGDELQKATTTLTAALTAHDIDKDEIHRQKVSELGGDKINGLYKAAALGITSPIMGGLKTLERSLNERKETGRALIDSLLEKITLGAEDVEELKKALVSTYQSEDNYTKHRFEEVGKDAIEGCEKGVLRLLESFV